MGTRLTDSPSYAHLWGTAELAGIFEDAARTQSWIEILVGLARAQARLGIIPEASARAIAEVADVRLLDLDYVAEQTRLTSHSTLGLIRGLQRILPEHAREHVYYGTTVQDITDTWFGIVMRDVGRIVWRDLHAIEGILLDLAVEHRSTLIVGRTHGQPGAPVTFGFKAASWADEVRRHLDRLSAGRERWATGQLAGAVGVLGFFGDDALELRRVFCEEVGLADPGISWLTARDRLAEFGHLLAMVDATLARIGNEVYQLQRSEIAELREPAQPGSVSSITMPHKRNPESAEHLGTLARLARASAGTLLESMVSEHERDGRSWKAEWIALPEICLLTGAALATARWMVSGLEVDRAAMVANLYGGALISEQLLAGLASRIGKHRAQELLHQLLREHPVDVEQLVSSLVAEGVADEEEIRSWAARSGIDGAAAMVDTVVERARRARSGEPAEWT